MGMFDGKSKEEKKAEKLEAAMKKHHLEDVSAKYAEQVKEINLEMLGTGLMETGAALSFGVKNEDMLKIAYLRTLVEQNWIIIRMLDELNKK